MSIIETKREFSTPPAPIGRRLPKYVQVSTTRHGAIVFYYRRDRKSPRIRIRAEPGTAEFNEAVQTARNGAPIAAVPFVYFARAGNKVKIGVSKNPKRRLGGLKTGNSNKVKIYYVTPGDCKKERDLHRLFAEHRVNGEWFLFSKAIRDWIAEDEANRVRIAAPTRLLSN